MNTAFKNRLKSFAWRLGMMVLAFVANYISTNLAGLELSPTTTVIAGLILGEISKFLSVEIQKNEKGSIK